VKIRATIFQSAWTLLGLRRGQWRKGYERNGYTGPNKCLQALILKQGLSTKRRVNHYREL